MISGVNRKVSRVTQTHDVEILTSVVQTNSLDEENENTLVTDVINREIENMKVAFDILDDGSKILFCHNKMHSDLVFDSHIALEYKACWVKDGHKTPQPQWNTFSGAVSRESYRVALTHATLNNVPICTCDV